MRDVMKVISGEVAAVFDISVKDAMFLLEPKDE
jgi:hypothetical protein